MRRQQVSSPGSFTFGGLWTQWTHWTPWLRHMPALFQSWDLFHGSWQPGIRLMITPQQSFGKFLWAHDVLPALLSLSDFCSAFRGMASPPEARENPKPITIKIWLERYFRPLASRKGGHFSRRENCHFTTRYLGHFSTR